MPITSVSEVLIAQIPCEQPACDAVSINIIVAYTIGATAANSQPSVSASARLIVVCASADRDICPRCRKAVSGVGKPGHPGGLITRRSVVQ